MYKDNHVANWITTSKEKYSHKSSVSIRTQVYHYLRTIFLDCQLGSAAFSQGIISGRH